MAPAATSDTLVYDHDIPGTRCGPEDGPWPRPYKLLTEEEIAKEISSLARPQRTTFDAKRGWAADTLNFQPCLSYQTQDRYVVHELDMPDGKWTLTGIFDGHMGDMTVIHTAYHLPIIIRDSLRAALKESPSGKLSVEEVSGLLSYSITSFDEAIASDVLALFPGGLKAISQLRDEEIRKVLQDHHRGGVNYKKARLCMYGTTALVSLVDPKHENLWIANLGDCQAVLVTVDAAGNRRADAVSYPQNGENENEVARVRREHPGEPECVLEERVLGAIAPFRCIGDTAFKQPPEFTRRILYNLLPGRQDNSPWEEFLVRNYTPPYISSIPEVIHRRLADATLPSSTSTPHVTDVLNGLSSNSALAIVSDGASATPGPTRRYLILSSDGLTDLYYPDSLQEMADAWAEAICPTLEKGNSDQKLSSNDAGGKVADNLAVRMLRAAIGGTDRRKVSMVLTLEMDVPWIDDVAIVVQSL